MTNQTVETIEIIGEDLIICPCGNQPHQDGFYCSDQDGTIRELELGPEDEWDGDTMACWSCGRTFSVTTQRVHGTMSAQMLVEAQAVVR